MYTPDAFGHFAAALAQPVAFLPIPKSSLPPTHAHTYTHKYVNTHHFSQTNKPFLSNNPVSHKNTDAQLAFSRSQAEAKAEAEAEAGGQRSRQTAPLQHFASR